MVSEEFKKIGKIVIAIFIGVLVFLTALGWSQVANDVISMNFEQNSQGAFAIYASIITIILIVVAFVTSKYDLYSIEKLY